jgi:hypothetical protein
VPCRQADPTASYTAIAAAIDAEGAA